jgi:1-acyl-sn-glycerol-3-phosphate acyltransferase
MAAAVLIVNAFPFQRQVHIRQSLSLCRELLANPGNILILFPEGTRSPDGKLGSFKPGIGTLLAGTDIAAVPCALLGAAAAWPKGSWLPRPRRVQLRIGAPRRYGSLTATQETARTIARDLEEAVGSLFDQRCTATIWTASRWPCGRRR